ncbi:ATP-dependent zinc metalloprotease FtsH [Planctopirus hydrillae]|uniref:ATP-dependent zinc metalloprotease FtsH n=1 Tax=Planctopirus hydrillae TaxID=1841610 RepID=A0A1C3EN74_9PLAN|nr:cell division protein FtsH [Planctopirus hydrillae]
MTEPESSENQPTQSSTTPKSVKPEILKSDPVKPDPVKTEPAKPLGTKRKAEKPGSSNLVWYLLIAIVISIGVFTLGGSGKRTTVEFSDFKQRLKQGSLTATNVFEVEIGPTSIRYQDQPGNKGREATSSKRVTPAYFVVPVVGMRDGAQTSIIELLDKNGINYGFSAEPPEWQMMLYYLGVPLILLAVFLYVFRKMAGPGAAMSFGRSRGKLYAQEEIGVTFQDVAGIDEAVEELREVVEFLKTPEKYQALGGRIPRGVLLVGPPGTGKTLLAKAVAGEAGVPFFGLSGSDFVEMFVGVGAARVRDMFQQAGERSPAIIFIDELDALGKVRGSGMPGGHDEREQTLNALLVEMDGFSSDQSVIVMGATNRPETLDPALMRPGRFDRHVLVDRPDVKGREAILKVHASKVKVDDHVNLKYLARLTPGFVGADLANLVNEAALLAARANKPKVTNIEFEEAVERIVAGLEKSTRIMPEEEKNRVAWHEIGHALVACSLPHVDPVHKVSIIPRGLGALGYTLQRPEEDRQLITKTELQNRICVLLGGIAAEDIVFNENSTGGSNDLQRATDLARRMVTEFGMSPKLGRVHYSDTSRSAFLANATTVSESAHSEETIREIDLEVRRIIDAAYETAHEILVTRRAAMDHLTRELLEIEVMDAEKLQQILSQYQTGPQIMPGTSAQISPHSTSLPTPSVAPYRPGESDGSTEGGNPVNVG